MNTPLSSSMCGSGCDSPATDELRQERHEEDRQLGIEEIDQDGGDDHLKRRAGAGLLLDRQRAVLAQRRPGQIEKVGDADILEDLEGDRAGMKQRGKPEDGGGHVRDDAERAAEGGDDARPRAARQARGKGVEHAGSRCDDDDQRRNQKLDAHGDLYPMSATARLAMTLTRLAR